MTGICEEPLFCLAEVFQILSDKAVRDAHRLWIERLDEEELRETGEDGPTIDGIEVGEFETLEEQRAWLQGRAPAFLRPPG